MGVFSNIVSLSANSIADGLIQYKRGDLHAIAPDDYENYLCSFELFDSDRNRKGFLSFVVMPEQISESVSPIQTITKTNGGIVTTINPSFSPIDINLSGTFGRKFRIVSNLKDPAKDLTGFFNMNFGKFLNMSIGSKSGYGLTKVLQHILQYSNAVGKDTQKPYFLCFNNYALNTHYIVDVVNYSFQQSQNTNMMWYYNISLRAVGYRPKSINGIDDSFLNSVASNAISNGLTNLITGMSRNI